MKKVIAIILVAVVALVAGFSLHWLLPKNVNEPVVNASTLEQGIFSIGEIATLEYDYTNVADLKHSLEIQGWQVPLTQKSLIVVLDGTMKIGVEASGITVNLSEIEKKVDVTLPKAKILSHEIHEKDMRVLDETTNLFNPISVEDYKTVAVAQKEEMENKVKSGDMFTRAQDDAMKMIRSFIEQTLPEDYTVDVKVTEAE